MNGKKNSRGITTMLFAAERVQSFLARLFEPWCVEAGRCAAGNFDFSAGAEARPQVVAISDGTGKTSRIGA